MGEIATYIKTTKPPKNNKEYSKMGYAKFREICKLVLRYQTYYPETHQAQHNCLTRPTCQKRCNGETQLTKHRGILNNVNNYIGVK